MLLNNAPVVHALGNVLDSNRGLLCVPTPRRRVVSEPCLPERLPSNGMPVFVTIVLIVHISSRVHGTRSYGFSP
jgi:hypothetical protein